MQQRDAKNIPQDVIILSSRRQLPVRQTLDAYSFTLLSLPFLREVPPTEA